MNKIDM